MISILGAATAYAQNTDREARSLYEAGTVAFSDGRFEDALSRWQEAYELSERPELLYNIATAYDRLGRDEEAVRDYARFLEARPDTDKTNYVRRRIEVLSASENDDAENDARDETNDEVELAPESPSRVGPGIVLAVAGAAAVTAIITGVVANSRYGDLEDQCPNGVCPPDAASDRDQLRRLTRTTDVLLGTALATGVGGLIWWLTSKPDAPEIAFGLGGCSVRGRF
ncbi:MAG: tetratricopeptide repeat protein [Myxococcota bacterium]